MPSRSKCQNTRNDTAVRNWELDYCGSSGSNGCERNLNGSEKLTLPFLGEPCCRKHNSHTGANDEAIWIRRDLSFLEQMFIQANKLRKFNKWPIEGKGTETSGRKSAIPPSQYYRQCKLAHCLKDIVSGTTEIRIIFHVRPEREYLQSTLEVMRFAQRAKFVRLNQNVSKEQEPRSTIVEEADEKLRGGINELYHYISLQDRLSKGSPELSELYVMLSPLQVRMIHHQATEHFSNKLNNLNVVSKDQVNLMYANFKKLWNDMNEGGQSTQALTVENKLRISSLPKFQSKSKITPNELKSVTSADIPTLVEDVMPSKLKKIENEETSGNMDEELFHTAGVNLRDKLEIKKLGGQENRVDKQKRKSETEEKDKREQNKSVDEDSEKDFLVILRERNKSEIESIDSIEDILVNSVSFESEGPEAVEVESTHGLSGEVDYGRSGMAVGPEYRRCSKISISAVSELSGFSLRRFHIKSESFKIQAAHKTSLNHLGLSIQKKDSPSKMDAWHMFIQTKHGYAIHKDLNLKQSSLRYGTLEHNDVLRKFTSTVSKLAKLKESIDGLLCKRNISFEDSSSSTGIFLSKQERETLQQIKECEAYQEVLLSRLETLRFHLQLQRKNVENSKDHCEEAFHNFCVDKFSVVFGKDNLPMTIYDKTQDIVLDLTTIKSDASDLRRQTDRSQPHIADVGRYDNLQRLAKRPVGQLFQFCPRRPGWNFY